MQFKKIKLRKVSDEIYDQIRNMIINTDIKPGNKLPPERELAEQLGVSRPSLREALNKLEAQGFLEQIQGDGTYVRSITQNSIDSAIEDHITKKEGIFDLIEIRKIFETWAAYTAAQRATPEEIKQMEEYVNEMRISTEKGEVGHVADVNFHYSISYATHNVLWIHIMNNVYQWYVQSTYKMRSEMFNAPEYHKLLLEHHTKLYEYIRDGESQKAYDLMLDHMNFLVGHMKKLYGIAE